MNDKMIKMNVDGIKCEISEELVAELKDLGVDAISEVTTVLKQEVMKTK